METNAPYILCSDGCIQRKSDCFYAGYVRPTEEGRWKLQNMQEKDYDFPAFPSCEEAALFLCMRGRAYQAAFEVHVNERIQVRVSPNFGKWRGCVLGLWAASLHHEDGRCAGVTRCASSIAEAKIAGIEQAYCGILAQGEARSKSEQSAWQEGAEI